MKNYIYLNVIIPPLMAAATIATARQVDGGFLWILLFIALVLGLAIVNCFAPLLLWQRHGFRSLLPLLAFVAALSASGAAATYGRRFMLAGTPTSPETFLRGSAQSDLEVLANELLDEGPSDRVDARLLEYGFVDTEIDSARRVVTLKYYRMRTWYEYIYAENGLPQAYSTEPRLTKDDFHSWGVLRLIAMQADPETSRPSGSIAFEPSIAVPFIRQVLGDSLLRDLRSGSIPRRVTPEEKARVVVALNRQHSVASRLVENPQVTYEGNPPMLRIGGRCAFRDSWESLLLEDLLKQGVLTRTADGRHLELKASLSEREQHGVQWLHVGLMNSIYGGLLGASEHTYDMQLKNHWYFRTW